MGGTHCGSNTYYSGRVDSTETWVSVFLEDVTCRNCLKKLIKEQESGND